MIYLASAIALIFVSNAIAMFVISSADISSYVDVMVVCRQLVETPEQCSAAALQAGLVGCISTAILIFLLFAAVRRFPGALAFREVSGAGFVAFTPLVVIAM